MRRAAGAGGSGSAACASIPSPVTHAGETRLDLSRVEFQLFLRLASEPTRVFSKAELLQHVWGYHRESRTRTLDSHACRLRSKLAAAGATRHVVNVWGVGYRLLDPVTAPERNGAA